MVFFSRQVALLLTSYLVYSATAAPLRVKREVPLEHSHEKYLTSVRASLNKNNPDGIVDPVFGLLGNAAASQGLGQISDPDCLHQATADQAFTNAKADGDVQGMVDALIFAALERNTGGVGVKSVLCTAIPATNPEIAALSQHQDPASEGAAETNKAITLELARQIAAVGGDPLQALDAGTFAPGDVNDPTGKGNSCNVLEDPEGCIFTQNLLVPDATEDEILAAVGEVAGGDNGGDNDGENGGENGVDNGGENVGNDGGDNAEEAAGACPTAAVTVTVTAGAAEATASATASAVPAAETPSADGTNLQQFTGQLGGVVAPTVVASGAEFQVEGNASFKNLQSALVRSCDVQNNKCANASNGAGQSATFSVGDCNAQQQECIDLARSS
ncbi:hypothetical protein FRC02_001979 [Tulasnella sp. 418]|nr:hypothetical protein FRC02_001979 [Tulasnella sp. 418]